MTEFPPIIFMPNGQPAPLLMTENEAIKFLRIDTVDIKHPNATLRRYRDCGLLRTVQISKTALYPLAELQKFIARKTEEDPR